MANPSKPSHISLEPLFNEVGTTVGVDKVLRTVSAANSGVDIGDVTVNNASGAAAVNIQDGGNTITVDGTVTATVDTSALATSAKQLADGHNVTVDNASGASAVNIQDGGNTITVDGSVKRDVINYTPIRKYYTNAGAVTDGIVWSPAAGKKWVITDIIINTSAAATITLEEDLAAGDSAFMKFELAANGGVSTNFQTPLFSVEDDADLLITTSAGTIYVCCSGYETD